MEYRMDYSSLLLIVGILIYGVAEYRRREQLHRNTLRMLREGEIPEANIAIPPLYRLWTTGFVSVILLVAVIGLVIARQRILYGGDVLFVLAAVFLFMFVMLFRIFIRDIRLRREHPTR